MGQPWVGRGRPTAAARTPPHGADRRRAPGVSRAGRPSCRRPSGPSSSAVRDRHDAGAGPGHWRRGDGLRRCRRRGPSAAAVYSARPAGDHLGHQRGEGGDPRSDLAGELHGRPGATGVRGRRGLVASGHQPRRSGTRAGPSLDHRGQWQPVRAPRREAAGRRRLPRRRAAVRAARADRRDQRPVVAHTLWRRPVGDRPAAAAERRALHRGRGDAARVPLSGRRGRVAAAALGHDAAQPRRSLHGSRRAHEAGRHGGAGPGRGRYPDWPFPDRVPADQPRLGHPAAAAARRDTRLLSPGAVGAAQRGRRTAGHRLHQRRVAAAHTRAVTRARSDGEGGAGRYAAAVAAADAGGRADPGGRRRRGWAWRSPRRRCRCCRPTRRCRSRGWRRRRWTFAR